MPATGHEISPIVMLRKLGDEEVEKRQQPAEDVECRMFATKDVQREILVESGNCNDLGEC